MADIDKELSAVQAFRKIHTQTQQSMFADSGGVCDAAYTDYVNHTVPYRKHFGNIITFCLYLKS